MECEITREANRTTLRILRVIVQELAHTETVDEFLMVYSLVYDTVGDMFNHLYDEGYTTRHDVSKWEAVWNYVSYKDGAFEPVEEAMEVMKDLYRTM